MQHTITLSLHKEDGTPKSRQELDDEVKQKIEVLAGQLQDQQSLMSAARKMGLDQAISYLVAQKKQEPLSPEEEEMVAIGKALCPDMGLSVEEPAVNYVLTHPGCSTHEVREAMGLNGEHGKNRWQYVLKKLGENPKVRKAGNKTRLRFFANEA